MQKLAVFGGTFNPVHWGHLLIAEAAFDQLQLDRVLWVPAYHPPHKESAQALLSYDQRLEMVQQAVIDHPNFEVSTIERDRSGTSYAIDTLRALQRLYPGGDGATQWYWIIGLDAFQALPRWYAHRELASSCFWLVAPRFNQSETLRFETALSEPSQLTSICTEVAQVLAAQSIQIQWQVLQMPLVGISSSLVREYCQQQRSIRYLVPDAVRRYIVTHRLYQQRSLLDQLLS